MKEYFDELAKLAVDLARKDELILLNYSAEQSDFVRFNHARIRQAGHVHHARLAISLIDKQKKADIDIDLYGQTSHDRPVIEQQLDKLRAALEFLPADPYLNYAGTASPTTGTASPTTGTASPTTGTASAPLSSPDMISQLLTEAGAMDLTGVVASGPLMHGFANSFGTTYWHETASFNIDASACHSNGHAVKAALAGPCWQTDQITRWLAGLNRQLDRLNQPARTLTPGRYRVYLAPQALDELLTLLSWRGFSLHSQRTGQSALGRLVTGKDTLSPKLSLHECHSHSFAPTFTPEGFVLDHDVPLIDHGQPGQPLANARMARQYHARVNSREGYPLSLTMAPGTLATDDIAPALDNGLWISNLWYTNFSDLTAGRLTGMTRFACFQVEHGRLTAPISPMRFDDSLYALFGSELEALTQEQELLLSSSTYGGRSLASARLPGMIINDMNFTL